MVRHIGRFGHRGFILRLAEPGAPDSFIGVPRTYWEIEYEGRTYPWRPVRPQDEIDLPQLMRAAIAYLNGDCNVASRAAATALFLLPIHRAAADVWSPTASAP
jgi:hypothetical protein